MYYGKTMAARGALLSPNLEQYSCVPDEDVARLRYELFREQVDDSMLLALLDVSSATLTRYIGQGLPFYKLGRRRLFDLPTVREWILSHQLTAKNAPARRPGRPRKSARV
jgi:hypothetical protein